MQDARETVVGYRVTHSTDNAAIQHIIDGLLPSYGGVVLFPNLAGENPPHYRIDCQSPIRVTKDNVTLLFEEGAVLQAEGMGVGASKIPGVESAIILAKDVSGLKIVGPGLLRGEREQRALPMPQTVTIEKGKLPGYGEEEKCFFKLYGVGHEWDDYAKGTYAGIPGDHGDNAIIEDGAGLLAWAPDAVPFPDGLGDRRDVLPNLRHCLEVVPKDLQTRLLVERIDQGTTRWILDDPVPDSRLGVPTRVTLLPGEYGMGIILKHATDFILKDFVVEDCWGDGIFLFDADAVGNADRCARGVIVNVTSRRNRRANLAIENAEDILVLSGAYNDAGSPVELTAPGGHKVVDCGALGARGGIFAEPDPSANRVAKGIGIIGVEASGNAADGILLCQPNTSGASVSGVVIERCICRGNGQSPAVSTYAHHGFIYRGCGIRFNLSHPTVTIRDNWCSQNLFGIRVNGSMGLDVRDNDCCGNVIGGVAEGPISNNTCTFQNNACA